MLNRPKRNQPNKRYQNRDYIYDQQTMQVIQHAEQDQVADAMDVATDYVKFEGFESTESFEPTRSLSQRKSILADDGTRLYWFDAEETENGFGGYYPDPFEHFARDLYAQMDAARENSAIEVTEVTYRRNPSRYSPTFFLSPEQSAAVEQMLEELVTPRHHDTEIQQTDEEPMQTLTFDASGDCKATPSFRR